MSVWKSYLYQIEFVGPHITGANLYYRKLYGNKALNLLRMVLKYGTLLGHFDVMVPRKALSTQSSTTS